METKPKYKNVKYKAVFQGWDDKEYVIYINKELIDDILFVVEAQMCMKCKNIVIDGQKYKHVDIYEIGD